MRSIALLAVLAVVVTACSQDTTEPSLDPMFGFSAADFGGLAYGMNGPMPGRSLPDLARLKRLPDELKLTAEQEAQINELLEAFQAAQQADLAALATILDQAKAAREARDRAKVRDLMAQARPIQERLRAAHLALRTAIDAVLTQAQKDWLAGDRERCNPAAVAPLSDAQKAEIRALNEAFQAATAADRELVKKAFADARAARQAGASAADVRAILDAARPAMERLQAAGDELRAAIQAVLTPEQLASGCFRGHGPRR